MIGKSKEFEDVGRVASSFPTYLGKIEMTLQAGSFRNWEAISFFLFSRRRRPDFKARAILVLRLRTVNLL